MRGLWWLVNPVSMSDFFDLAAMSGWPLWWILATFGAKASTLIWHPDALCPVPAWLVLPQLLQLLHQVVAGCCLDSSKLCLVKLVKPAGRSALCLLSRHCGRHPKLDTWAGASQDTTGSTRWDHFFLQFGWGSDTSDARVGTGSDKSSDTSDGGARVCNAGFRSYCALERILHCTVLECYDGAVW